MTGGSEAASRLDIIIIKEKFLNIRHSEVIQVAASNVADYPELLNKIKDNRKVVYLCGTGASMSLGEHSLSWLNWILAGKEYLEPKDQEKLIKKLGSHQADELIDAATFLLSCLHENGKYCSFMNDTVGNIHPSNYSFTNAIQTIWRTGDLIATTNYDLSIEKVVGAEYVSYSQPAEILSAIRDGENKVIHLHGVYDSINNIDDIVADRMQYRSIMDNEGAQFVQNLLSTYTLIIVGCGGTVEDPNLSGFMSFVVEKLGAIDVPYFYLMKNCDTVPNLPSNAVPVFYGDNHSDLPIFLEELSILRLRNRMGLKQFAEVNPYLTNSFATSAFGRMHYSNQFSEFIGRERELNLLNNCLDSDKHFLWWSVVGEGGIGKSRLVYEWLQTMPAHWVGFFAYKNCENAMQFVPFTDTVIVFDYVLYNEAKCAETVSAYLDAFRNTNYKLRIVFIERSLASDECSWMNNICRALKSQNRIEFEAGCYQETPLIVSGLSTDDEIVYIKNYLHRYLSLIPQTDFTDACKTSIDKIGQRIGIDFRQTVDSNCYRPLYLSIFTEVWINKGGQLSIKSTEELLFEYLNKERTRWEQLLGNDALVDSYLRLLAIACVIELFNITDVYGDYYLLEDANKLTQFLDQESSKPGGSNTFPDLFISMDELVEDDSDNTVIEVFANCGEGAKDNDGKDVTFIAEMDEDERFAYATPYIKIDADPHEVYLTMLEEGGVADDEQLKELEIVRAKRMQRVKDMPNHAWIIHPVFPSIIKEYIVSYVVNDRDVVQFTKLARSNSILSLPSFIMRALEDWKDKTIFQKMAVIPPDEVLNYFEYYTGLMISLRNVDNLLAVEQELIDSVPFFMKYEMELWRRIAVVLTERGDIDRLYDSSCRFVEYLRKLERLAYVRDDVATVVEGYCIGLHNAEAQDEYESFLSQCDAIAQNNPDNAKLGEVLCENYQLLMNLKLYHDDTADIDSEWDKIKEYIERYNYQEKMCVESMKAAHEFILSMIGRDNIGQLYSMRDDLEGILLHQHNVEVAEMAALCSANIYTYTFSNFNRLNNDEGEKIKNYYNEFPKSKRICASYLTVRKIEFLDASSYKKVPDKLLNKAKLWAHQYPEDIEFSEGYFGLLLARLEYAQDHNDKKEQKAIYREMKVVAKNTDYSEYNEDNEMLRTVELLHDTYGWI